MCENNNPQWVRWTTVSKGGLTGALVWAFLKQHYRVCQSVRYLPFPRALQTIFRTLLRLKHDDGGTDHFRRTLVVHSNALPVHPQNQFLARPRLQIGGIAVIELKHWNFATVPLWDEEVFETSPLIRQIFIGLVAKGFTNFWLISLAAKSRFWLIDCDGARALSWLMQFMLQFKPRI